MEVNRVYCSDCLDFMAQIPDEYVDLVVTDPPYGISFMGKDWDRALPPVKVWSECLRVLKSGGFAFVMSIPRADCLSRMIQNLEEAGFNVGFTPIYWAYATGFPKASNISLMTDKRACRRELTERLGRKPSKEEFDEAWKNFREKVAVNPNQRLNRPELDIYEAGIRGKEVFYTKPRTPEAQALDGSYGGFQPKPAVEVIIVAMKPKKFNTYIDQALDNRKSIVWFDDCRIPIISDEIKPIKPSSNLPHPGDHKDTWANGAVKERELWYPKKGRFPANLLVSDNILNDGKITPPSGDYPRKRKCKMWFGNIDNKSVFGGYPDSGGFSRYFSLDVWWADRVKQLPREVQRTFPFLIVPKASKSERNKGLESSNLPMRQSNPNYGKGGFKRPTGEPERKIAPAKNFHPTVKPVKLFSYLVTLGSRLNDLVLDPYIGSGTTGIACKMFGRNFLGCDNNQEYVEIARTRIANQQRSLTRILEAE